MTPEENVRYPIGRFKPPASISVEQRRQWMETIEEFPEKLAQAIAGLNDEQLETPYREGGWTVRQLVHHLADSHMNSYVRFRLALTEDSPVIKTYEEARWAELPDAQSAPPGISLKMLEAMHGRWILLLHSFSDADYARTFRHPEHGAIRLDWTLGLYAWHSLHHVAHINNLRTRQNW